MFKISSEPFDPASLQRVLAEARAGACVTFEGWVRNHNEGQAVQSLEYEAYAPLAVKEGERILAEAHEKYALFGGKFAAFDPVTNLRVGVKVLEECISRAGSIEGGLKFYVGAANLEDDGGYVGKVMAEHSRLQAVASGKRQPFESQTAPVGIPVTFPLAPIPTTPRGASSTQSVALLRS